MKPASGTPKRAIKKQKKVPARSHRLKGIIRTLLLKETAPTLNI